MRIFVTTGVLLHETFEDYYTFLSEILKIVIERNAEHEFIIHSREADTEIFSAINVIHVKMRSVLRHSLLAKMWYNLKLPAILKKYKADVFISFDGLCSMPSAIPQIIFFNDSSLPGNSFTSRSLRSSFYIRYAQKSLQKAKTIICSFDFRKQDLMLRYQVESKRVEIMYPTAKEIFQPLIEDVKEEVRMKHCEGKNYFIYTGTCRQREDLFNLLKGFSAFKKRQKSNWKLLLMGNPHQYDKKFMDSLATFKYRSDIVMAKVNEGERARLIASAYAVICAVHSEVMVFPIVQALKCGVPLISTDVPAVREIVGNECLFFDPADPESIAAQMMTIYKDESFRNTLIEKGRVTAMKYSFDKSAELFSQCIFGH